MMKKLFILCVAATMIELSVKAQDVDGYTGATKVDGRTGATEIKNDKVDANHNASHNGKYYAQWNTDSTEIDSYDRYRIGGYGEVVAAFKNYGTNRYSGSPKGNTHETRNTISIPRFVLAGDFKFNKHWNLGAEIEFESGGTGSSVEIEQSENGERELEIEKGGEVALEQFHLTYHLNQYFNVRAGHMIVPVGLNNEHHEPLNFFGTVRPEGETSIIPNTWHETGISLFGQVGRRWASFQWQVMVVAGLNANGFSRDNWVKSGKQGIFETDNFTSPGYVARINYTGVPGLRLGGSFYYCHDTGRNADASSNYSYKVPVTIWSVDAEYKNRWVIARGNVLMGNMGNSDKVSTTNTFEFTGTDPYSHMVPVAHKAVSYGGEAGLRIQGFVPNKKYLDITPFFRYEYYNSQEKVDAPRIGDERQRTSVWIAGLNYSPIKNLVIKADYTWRSIGSGKYNSENEFAIGVAYAGWFFSDRTIKAYKERRQLKHAQILKNLNDRLAKQQAEIDELKLKMNN